jgi:hypothetical protein
MTTTLTLNKTQIITKAMQIIGALPSGQLPTDQEMVDNSLHLNLLLKSYLAEGLINWHQDLFILFPVKGQTSYIFPPNNTDQIKWTTESALLTSTLAEGCAAGDSILTLSNPPTSNFNQGQVGAGTLVGVTLTDNTLFWSYTQNEVTDTQVSLIDSLSASATKGACIYFLLDNGAPRSLPSKLVAVMRRNATHQDFPLRPLAFHDYQRLTTKTQTGIPLQYTTRETLTDRRIYLWPTPQDSTYRIYLQAQTEYTVMEDDSSPVPISSEGYLALVWELASLLGIEFGCDINLLGVITAKAQYYKDLALGFGTEGSYVQLAPDYGP